MEHLYAIALLDSDLFQVTVRAGLFGIACKIIDIIGVVVIVWRVRGKIIRSVLCSIVCNNRAQCNAHT